MTKPEKSPEPSMEDILASIRKIIADDPVKADGGKDGSAGLHAGGTNGSAATPTSVAKPGTSGININSPATNEIDSLLDDAVDDPPLARAPSSPSLPSSGLFAPAPGQRPVPEPKKPVVSGAPTSSPPPTPPKPGALPELKPSIERPRSDGTGGDRPAFPSLGGSLAARLPQDGPGLTGRPADLSRTTLPPAFEEFLGQRGSNANANGGAPAKSENRPPDLGAIVPGAQPASGAGPASNGSPIATTAAGPTAQPPRHPGARNGAVSPSAHAAPASPKPADDVKAPAGRSPSPAAPPPAATSGVSAAAPSMAATPSGPAAGTGRLSSPSAPDKSAAVPQKPAEVRPRDAAHGSLGGSDPSAAGPVASPAPAAGSAPSATTAVPQPGTHAQPIVSAAQVKTLEDTLSEVLRPVVRQWVIENMPRIVQEVAQQEVAKLPKPEQK